MKGVEMLLSCFALSLLAGCATVAAYIPEQCLKKPDVGPCRGSFPKYYYDGDRGECALFTYGGCDGSVPFESIEDCRTTCLSTTTTARNELGSSTHVAAPVRDFITCLDNPCSPQELCVDSRYPIACFVAPCPQYHCYANPNKVMTIQ
ncbi:hypothetical protein BC832DRAFT_160154 [Gaertneriomyces semiglobifer]|nr:hypothetical protein BC832DRAFT_160154 [Gaertneriomyces semiglobifer]